MAKDEIEFWREDETYSDYKRRKYANKGKSISQPNSVMRSVGDCDNTKLKKNICKCKTCVARRNRNKGRRKQNRARKLLKIPNNRFAGADAHEENWQTDTTISKCF